MSKKPWSDELKLIIVALLITLLIVLITHILIVTSEGAERQKELIPWIETCAFIAILVGFMKNEIFNIFLNVVTVTRNKQVSTMKLELREIIILLLSALFSALILKSFN